MRPGGVFGRGAAKAAPASALQRPGELAATAVDMLTLATAPSSVLLSGMEAAVRADGLVVTDDDSARLAADLGGRIVAAERELDERTKPIRALVQEARDAVSAFMDRFRVPLARGKADLQRASDAYRARQRLEREEAEAKARAAAPALPEALREAVAGMAPGVRPEVSVGWRPPPVAPPPLPPVVRGETGTGVVRKGPPKVRVLDIKAVPPEYLLVNDAMVVARWRTTGQQVPGTEVYQEETTGFRSR